MHPDGRERRRAFAGLRRLAPQALAGPAGAILLLAAGTSAWAAGAAQQAEQTAAGGGGEIVFVAKIVLLLLVGRGLGELLERLGQPAVVGQLIGGILLGPSLFGWAWPSAQHLIFASDPQQKSMIDAVAELGILLLLLLTGMEADLRLVRRVGAACISISTAGILIPFLCGFGLAQLLPDSLLPQPDARVVAGLFLGTALSISSVKIVAVIVREMGFLRRNLGQVILSSAIIEDTIGWLIVALTLGIAARGRVELLPLAGTMAGVAAFMAFSFTIGRRVVFTLIRWTNDTIRSDYAVITVILIIMGVMALATDLVGVHAVLGAFVAGILVGESPILTDHIEGQLRGIITALFMPVFFGVAGLSADLTVLADPTTLLLTVLLVLIASLGKFSGAFAGGALAGLSRRESIAVGSAMNARGSTEIIVATIGLSMGVLSQTLFTMIVTMAIVTTLAMPPTLRWALGRVPMGDAEKQRLEREEMDQRGFVSKLERLLLTADDSAVGRFSAYLAGLIGGGSGMPTTLVRLDSRPGSDGGTGSQRHVREIRKGAEASATAVERAEETSVEKVHLTARDEQGLGGEAVAEEARKGYDMLVVGLGRALTPKRAFSKKLRQIVSGFDGPLCLVLKGTDKNAPMPALGSGAVILVPVNGTEVARRAADLALAMARPHRATVKALYLARHARTGRTSLSLRHEEAVLRDIVDLADRYDVPVETEIRTRAAADVAICREAARNAIMVVMGASRRSGDELFFGETAAAVVANCPVPIVLLGEERVRRDRAEVPSKRGGKADSAKAETAGPAQAQTDSGKAAVRSA